MSGPSSVIAPSQGDTKRYAALLPLIVVVGKGDRLRLVVCNAFHSYANVARADTVADALLLLAHQPVHTLLVEATDGRGTKTQALVEEARRRFPRTSIVACLPDRRGMSESHLELVRAGAHDILAVDEINLRHTLRAIVASARLARVADVTTAEICVGLDPEMARCVRIAIRESTRPFDVSRFAATLGVHRKTLWQRCHRLRVRSPRNLLVWCRILAASFVLEEGGRSADSVANELDFASPSAMRNLFRRYLGLTPTELRERGGSQYIAKHLATLLT